jgi:hypothetical protein
MPWLTSLLGRFVPLMKERMSAIFGYVGAETARNHVGAEFPFVVPDGADCATVVTNFPALKTDLFLKQKLLGVG